MSFASAARVLSFAALTLVACSRPKHDLVAMIHDETDAVVGSVSRSQMELELARIRRDRGVRSDAALPESIVRAVLDRSIEHELMLVAARKLNIQSSTMAVERQVEGMRGERGERAFAEELVGGHTTLDELKAGLADANILSQLLAREVQSQTRVDDAEVRAAYDALPEAERVSKLRVRVRHIVVRTKEEGKVVLDKLAKKARFPDLAREHSIAPEGASGGDLGWLVEGSMPQSFDICFRMEAGQVSPLIASEYGFHVFRVEGVQPPAPIPYEVMRDALKAKILARKIEEGEQTYIQSLRSRYRVELDSKALEALE